MKPDGGERERFAWSDPAGENRSWGAIRTRERRADLPGKLSVYSTRSRCDRSARRSTDTSSEPALAQQSGRVNISLDFREGAYRKSWWWNPRCWRSHRRRRRRASRRRRHRQPKEGKGWTGGLGSADGRRRTDEVRGKGDTRLRSFPRVSIRGTLSNQRPPRIARPARTRRERGFKSFGVSTTRIGRSRHRGGPGRGDTHGEDGQGSATGSLVSGGQGHHGGTLRGDGGDRASAESLGLAREGGARHDGGRSGGNGSHFDLRGVQRLA